MLKKKKSMYNSNYHHHCIYSVLFVMSYNDLNRIKRRPESVKMQNTCFFSFRFEYESPATERFVRIICLNVFSVSSDGHNNAIPATFEKING